MSERRKLSTAMEWMTALELSTVLAGNPLGQNVCLLQDGILKPYCCCHLLKQEMVTPPYAAAHQLLTNVLGDQKSTSEAKDLDGLMQELYRQESRKAKMEIGDFIRVRGYIKVFRNQREVVASTFYKVDDPTLDVQITRMLDTPHLYRNVYDKPFIIPYHLKDPSNGLLHDAVLSRSGLILQLCEKIKEFLEANQICNFYQRELESVPSLLSTANKPSHKTEESSSVTSKEIHNLFKEAIHLLQEQGIVYTRGRKIGVYQVTDRDKELHKLALSIIQEDCRRQRHADKGCHFLHILNCVQQTFSSSINETILQRVIDALEKNSDIISTMEKHYTSF